MRKIVEELDTKVISIREAASDGIVVWFEHGKPIYKLHRVGSGDYAFITLNETETWANGEWHSREAAIAGSITYLDAVLMWFEDFDDFIKYVAK